MVEDEIVKNIRLIGTNSVKNIHLNEFDIKCIELIIINNGQLGVQCSIEIFIHKHLTEKKDFFIGSNNRLNLTEIKIDDLNKIIEIELKIGKKGSNLPTKINYIINKKWYIKNRHFLIDNEIEIKGKPSVLNNPIIKIEIDKIVFNTRNTGFKKTNIKHKKYNKKEYVLDLHIDPKNTLHPFTHILLDQLKLAEEFIDKALVLNLSEVVLIHGIGDGVLKKELHNLLKNHKMVISFHNIYSPKYGYGATFVNL